MSNSDEYARALSAREQAAASAKARADEASRLERESELHAKMFPRMLRDVLDADFAATHTGDLVRQMYPSMFASATTPADETTDTVRWTGGE